MAIGSYDQSVSQSFKQGNTSASLTNLAGQLVTGNFAGEACEILDFSYNASGEPTAFTPASGSESHDCPRSCHYPTLCQG